MLMLSRKQDEAIIIKDKKTGNVTRILVTKITGKVVRIGIDSPESVVIVREEVMKKEK